MYLSSGCRGVLLHPKWTMCCGGRIYFRTSSQSECCGAVGYDAGNNLCCQGVVRRRHANARCCGSRGYDTRYGVCVGGDVRRRSNLGSTCCHTGGRVTCCRKSEGCCSTVAVHGFRPACCEVGREQAECCSALARRTLLLPSCCARPEVRPVCCHKRGGISCCPPGRRGPECCRNDLTRVTTSATTPTPAITTTTAWSIRDDLPCCHPGEYPPGCQRPRPCGEWDSQQCCSHFVDDGTGRDPNSVYPEQPHKDDGVYDWSGQDRLSTIAATSESTDLTTLREVTEPETLSQTSTPNPPVSTERSTSTYTTTTTKETPGTSPMPIYITRATLPPTTAEQPSSTSGSGLVALQLSCCIAPDVAGCCLAASRITSITPHCCMPG